MPDLSGNLNYHTPSSQPGANSVSPPGQHSLQNTLSEDRTPPDSVSSFDNAFTPPSPPTSKNTPAKKTSPKPTSSTNSKDSKVAKRTLNTLAARRYRQRRVDQVNDLETALKETQSERDELKVRVARLEGELEVLKSLLKR